MNKKDFIEKVESKGYTVVDTKDEKCGVKRKCLRIYKDDASSGVTKWYSDDEFGFDDVDEVIKMVEESSDLKIVKILESFEVAKDYIYKTVLNEKASKGCPSLDFIEDMRVVYIIDDNDKHCGIIRDELVEKWGVTVNDLEEVAKSYDYKACDIGDRLFKGGFGVAGSPIEDFEFEGGKLYVITNKDSFYGAGAILRGDIINKILESLPEGYFILPSSKHEIMMTAKMDFENQGEKLAKMVYDINRSEVDEIDFLSDYVIEVTSGGELITHKYNEDE